MLKLSSCYSKDSELNSKCHRLVASVDVFLGLASHRVVEDEVVERAMSKNLFPRLSRCINQKSSVSDDVNRRHTKRIENTVEHCW